MSLFYHSVSSVVPSGLPHLVTIIHWFFQTSILLFVVFITMFYLLYPLVFFILLLLYIDSFRPVSLSLLSLSQYFICCTLWPSLSCYYYTLILSDQFPPLCGLYHNISSVLLFGLPHLVTIIHWSFQTSIFVFVVLITMFNLLYYLVFVMFFLLDIDSFRLVSFSFCDYTLQTSLADFYIQ